MPRLHPRLAFVIVLAGLAVAVRAGGSPPASGDLVAWRAAFSRDSLAVTAAFDRGQPDSGLALAATFGEAYAKAPFAAVRARGLMLRPVSLLRLARAKDALPGILEAERVAEASGDTAVWMLALRSEAVARNFFGDFARAARLAQRWDALAKASGNVEYQGWAGTMRGWFAWHAADLVTARRELEHSLALVEQVPWSLSYPYTLNVLASVMSAQGDYTAARPLYQRILDRGHLWSDPRTRLMALESLARVDSRVGDPTKALANWREAMAIREARQETSDWLVDADNVCSELMALGRNDEAVSLAERAVAAAERESLGMEISWQRVQLGNACRARGQEARARALLRSVLATPIPGDEQPRAEAAVSLVESLAEGDSVAAALALAEAEAPKPGSGLEQEVIARLAIARADLLTRLGRPEEALAAARPVAEATEASGDLEWALAAWTQAVRAERRLARPGDVARDLERATALWERSRSHVAAPEFREVRGEQAHALMLEAVAEALERAPGDVASPFAIVQRFKTRTLLEHVAGPAALAGPAPSYLDAPLASLATFQSATLAPDELFLECACGPETTFVIAVTRDTCRVLAAPGARSLEPALAALGSLHAPTESAERTARALAGARLGSALLGDVADLLASHPAVVVAADDALHSSPVGEWTLPGVAASLGATHRIAYTPSASMLALLRARQALAPGRMLAILGATRTGGATLRGARREVGALAGRYRDIEEWDAGRAGASPLTVARLAGYAGLHFAGHAIVDPQVPWRSGLLLGRAHDGSDSLLTADRIAAARIPARLVVLSSCESGAGRSRAGEGVTGLATAFLAAGGSAVVASRWPVEDRAAAQLMDRFYAHLAKGESADRALAGAQAELRADPATADPFYWSGFVVVGDGRTTWPLAERPVTSRRLAGGAAALIAVAAVALASRRRRTGR